MTVLWCDLAGERVPCDGEVIDGLAAIDESMLTGESVLVPKAVGAAVAGGCIVFEGPLTIKASATGAESALAGKARGSVATTGVWHAIIAYFHHLH